MAYVDHSSPFPAVIVEDDHEPRTCFLCSDELPDDGYMAWVGATGTIRLHVACCEEFGVKLVIDSIISPARGDAA